MIPADKLKRFLAWDKADKYKRSPRTLKELAAELGKTEVTLRTWRNGIKKKRTTDEVGDLIEHIRKLAFRPNPNSKMVELYTKIVFPPNQPVKEKDGLSPREINDIVRRIETRLAENHRGDLLVQERHKVLPEELCFHSEQEHGTEDEVDAVVVST